MECQRRTLGVEDEEAYVLALLFETSIGAKRLPINSDTVPENSLYRQEVSPLRGLKWTYTLRAV